MTEKEKTEEQIHEASEVVGSVWPLHSFVTANPLSGFEDLRFHEAVRKGEELFGGSGYPSTETFREAWQEGRIDEEVLVDELRSHGYDATPEEVLDTMGSSDDFDSHNAASDDRVDRIVSKWLSAFCDQGRAKSSMPHRDKGFYEAFRRVAKHDTEIPDSGSLSDLPDDPVEAVASVVSDVSEDDREAVFEHHLSALPGWVGFIKQRASDSPDWQDEYPIDLTDYLAVRLAVVDLLGAELLPSRNTLASDDGVPAEEVWLRAWERSYRDRIVPEIADGGVGTEADGGRPDAQMVFCIDTRSEIIRRAIEETGDYETHGYAGFFGVPMEYDAHDKDTTVDACPPIVEPQHRIPDEPACGCDGESERRDTWLSVRNAWEAVSKKLETNVATAYNYVEAFGSFYGAAMAARTLVPSKVYDATEAMKGAVPRREDVYSPVFDTAHGDGCEEHDGSLPVGMTTGDMADYAEAAFSLMGWEDFARVVVFAGHASETQNNPFDSALDCGACAGNPGGPSARVLAAICNDDRVRNLLADRGYDIPDDTVFVAGEHNTTTDEVKIFASDVPESHADDIESLRWDLEEARTKAATERAAKMEDGFDEAEREVERRSADWAETRPEWGLAGNAAFVIGPRELTEDVDLNGRSFLHSYDWSTDTNGDALEAIMKGPMVVTQWINSQYYFATVDNTVYGSGSKVTQNPVGNMGVYQGNGGDIMTGLPLQSLYLTDDKPYHQPMRLTTVIHAPVERVEKIVRGDPSLACLLDNGWMSLTVVDPDGNGVFEYVSGTEWERIDQTAETPKAVVSADD